MDSIQKGDFNTAKTLIADNFQFSGPVPEPINREAWLKMSANLRTAFPDLNYHFKVEGEEGDTIKIAAQLKGTHIKDLDVTAMNMGIIPATKKSFTNAHEHGKVTVKGNKVTLWAMEPVKGGGLMGILDQLDVKVPAM